MAAQEIGVLIDHSRLRLIDTHSTLDLHIQVLPQEIRKYLEPSAFVLLQNGVFNLIRFELAGIHFQMNLNKFDLMK